MSGPWEDFAPTASGPWEDFAPKKATITEPEPQHYGVAANIAGAVVEPVLAMGTGMLAKPVSDIAGLTRLAMEGFRRAGVPGIAERDPLTVSQDVIRAMTYAPRTGAGQAVTEYNPLALFGKGVNWLGQQAQDLISSDTSPTRSALGSGVHEAVNQAPMFLGMKAPVAAAAVDRGANVMARELMQSALKPPLRALQTGQAASAIDTLLEDGVNVTKGGVEKLNARIEIINDAIKDQIRNSTAVIDKNAVASRLTGVLEKFRKQVTPLSDVAAIQKAWDEFINHPLLNADTMPVQTAQELKQGTYRALGSKAYGELKGADIEAQKNLARGLKEEIAQAVPQVRPLNAEESKLLDALSLVERRVLVSANKNPMGLGWLTTNPTHFMAYMADRSELFKSLIARMLSKATPEMTVAGPVAGAAITEQAEQAKQP